jgi:hypothetical protein
MSKSAAVLNPTAENVLRVWETATDVHRENGMAWYALAHRIAHDISGGDIVRGAGVLAALSPQKEWNLNIRLAARAFETGVATGNTGPCNAKANAILAGANPLDVMGNGLKTRNFYVNILDPECADALTIDRHAYDVALAARAENNKRLGLTPTRYAAFAAAYVGAADTLGILPHQLQAVTWEAWREVWAWQK